MQVFMCSHVFIAAEFLGKITDKSLEFLPFFQGIEAIDPDFSITLLEDAADNSHKCCFSCTIWSKQTEHPVPDVERNTAESFERLLLFPDKGNGGYKFVDCLSYSPEP